MHKVGIVGIVVAAVAVALGCYVLVSMRGETPVPEPEEGRQAALLTQKGAQSKVVKSVDALRVRPVSVRSVTNKAGRVVQVVAGGRLGADDNDIFCDENGKEFPAEEQAMMRQARAVVENDDLDGARELAEKAVNVDNVQLRAMVVEALSWFGHSAMAELTGYMSDADEEVAEEACSSWLQALQEIEDEGLKAGVIELALSKLKDREMLSDVANELVGIDELAAVQVLVNVIVDGENANAVPAAKEAYNSITSEDWSGVDAAEAWLQENYTAPESTVPVEVHAVRIDPTEP